MGRQALDRERPRHADDLAILIRTVEQCLGLSVLSDGGVDLITSHALVEVGVLSDGLERHVWHALVDEPASDVVVCRRNGRNWNLACQLSFLADAGL